MLNSLVYVLRQVGKHQQVFSFLFIFTGRRVGDVITFMLEKWDSAGRSVWCWQEGCGGWVNGSETQSGAGGADEGRVGEGLAALPAGRNVWLASSVPGQGRKRRQNWSAIWGVSELACLWEAEAWWASPSDGAERGQNLEWEGGRQRPPTPLSVLCTVLPGSSFQNTSGHIPHPPTKEN